MFGEDTCNASGNRLIYFLNEVELVVCNGRSLPRVLLKAYFKTDVQYRLL